MAMVHCECKSLYCVCYRNAVGFLERRVASAASYPAWSAVETSRPKVLVFLRLWWMLSSVTSAVVRLAIGSWSMRRARKHTPHPTIQHFPLHISHFNTSHSSFNTSHFSFNTSHFPLPIPHFSLPISHFSLLSNQGFCRRKVFFLILHIAFCRPASRRSLPTERPVYI